MLKIIEFRDPVLSTISIRKDELHFQPMLFLSDISGVPRNFFRGGFNKFSWGQRGRGSGGGSPL